MDTLVDNAISDPEPVYLRSGIAQFEVAAGHAVPPTPPVPAAIPLVSDHVIVGVTTTDNESNAVELPSDAPVGALVEIFTVTEANVVTVVAPDGETIEGSGSSASGQIGVWRKVTSTVWRKYA